MLGVERWVLDVDKNRMHSRLALFVAVALTVSAQAQEWTRFRGPNGTGIGRADLPEQLTDRNVQWRCTLPGSGHSSPVVWGDRIFVTATPDGAGPSDQARRVVVCVGAKDGKIQWQREFATGSYRKHADNSFASPSCAVDAERVYAWFAGPDGSQLVALAQADGKPVWKQDLGPFTSQHGPGASPIMVEGKVVLQSSQDGPGSFIGAWQADTGKPVWKVDIKSGQHSIATPLVYGESTEKKEGKPQIIGLSSENGLFALDPSTGKQLWALSDLFKLRCVASPVVLGNGYILGQSGQGQAASEISVIKGVNTGKPEKAYEIVRTGGYVPTPVAAGGLLFLWKENGLVTCLKADSNEQIWSERVEGPYYSSPILVNVPGGTPRLYNVTRGGELVAVEAGEKFRLIQRFPLGEKNSYATPAVSGNRLYVRTYTQLISIGK
jgi:outer membrane protein assembly factor BamB